MLTSFSSKEKAIAYIHCSYGYSLSVAASYSAALTRSSMLCMCARVLMCVCVCVRVCTNCLAISNLYNIYEH